MESPRLNDLICDILQDAAKRYPLDLSRVYLTGHSHNGHFVQEFARRHPDVVACIAPLGNSPGLPNPAVSHEAVVVDDARAAQMETMDLPTCIVCGCCEVGGMVTIYQTAHAFQAGNQCGGLRGLGPRARLPCGGAGCRRSAALIRLRRRFWPRPTAQTRPSAPLGIPTDRAQTVWLDGFEALHRRPPECGWPVSFSCRGH